MESDWQTESGLRTAVFISATSSDLADCRNRIASVLRKAGVYDIEQTNFAHSPLTIEEDLTAKILSADAVICLIGGAFGAAPTVDGRPGERSYTQMEYDLAVHYERPIYLFIATDEFLEAHPVGEPDRLRSNQIAHRKALLRSELRYQQFSTEEELERRIVEILAPIRANVARRSIRYVHIPSLPTCFVGRSDELIQINNAMDRSAPAVITIIGMGGQGKTTLLAQALRQRQGLPFAAALWVSAERGDFTFSEFLDCALSEFLGRRFRKEEMAGLETRLRALIGQLQVRPLLIVIDAMERWLKGWITPGEVGKFGDFSLREGAQEGLDRFLSEASALENGSHIVLTSRALPAALDMVACAILPVLPADGRETGLQALPPDQAAELLLRLGVDAPREKLLQLAESMVGHPLTLTGFARVARRLGTKWESLWANRAIDPSIAFHSLVDEIRNHLPDRERSEVVLRFASLLSEGASLGLLKWLTVTEPANVLLAQNEPDLLPLILMLADWNLLVWDPETEEIRLHGLMAAYFVDFLKPAERESIHHRAAAWYATKDREGGDMRLGILAVRHAMSANEPDSAFLAMFEAGGDTRSLYQRMVSCGHLWECASLLEDLLNKLTGTARAKVVVAWGQILNDLELSQSALAEVKEAARTLLAEESPRSPENDVLIARCLGLEGLIHLETGRASDALPVLDRAAGIFRTFANSGMASEDDLMRTVANRALAKWSTGDWDGAEVDWRSILQRLHSTPGEDNESRTEMRWELEARVAMLAVDRGRAAEAIPLLELALGELEKIQASDTANPSKTNLHTKMLLVDAYIENGQNREALAMAQQMATQLEGLSRLGRWEFHGLLAQLRMNQATAMLKQGEPLDALAAADRAVRLYEDIQRRGAAQFRGQYASALFRRAEARNVSGDVASGIEDLQSALTVSEDWIRQWYGECNIQRAFIENALRALAFLPSGHMPEKLQIFRMLRECAERITTSTHPLATNVREAQLLSQHAEELQRIGRELETPWTPALG